MPRQQVHRMIFIAIFFKKTNKTYRLKPSCDHGNTEPPQYRKRDDMNPSSSLDQGAEDASGYRCGLGGRKPLLDWLWPGCHRSGSDVRSALQDAHLWHDRRALRHCGGSTERVGDAACAAYTTNDFCLCFFVKYCLILFVASEPCTGRTGGTILKSRRLPWTELWDRL